MSVQKPNLSNNDISNVVKNELRELIEKHGPFTAQNFDLGGGIYTIDEHVNFDHFKLNRIKQLVNDFGNVQAGTTLLDIASLESMFAIEFAMDGLEVTSIEGRESNLVKGKFVADKLNLSNIKFFEDDVTNIKPETYGQFDIILCLGILYHINKDKYLAFLKNITASCNDILIIDTFISLRGGEILEHDGHAYDGTTWREFEEFSSPQEKEDNKHASLNDNLSYSMTKESLVAYLDYLGYSSVCEMHLPAQPNSPKDRITLLCKKGSPVSLKVFPKFNYTENFKAVIDTRGIGKNSTVHWNENIVKKYLRRIYRYSRNLIKRWLRIN
ncbi:MAG: class I SAM-dependent methyltransferase [Candidatus Marinimicrobia bacterium]|nr:class I SAM-dependent methyltransferase [Candidatus Neomarinimicrobiota bacterium]